MQTPRQLGLRFAGIAALMSLIYSSFTASARFGAPVSHQGRSRARASTRMKPMRYPPPINYRRAAAARAGHVSDRCPFAGMPYTTIAQHDEYKRSRMPGTPEHQAVEYGIAAVKVVYGNGKPVGCVPVWP